MGVVCGCGKLTQEGSTELASVGWQERSRITRNGAGNFSSLRAAEPSSCSLQRREREIVIIAREE